MRILLTGAKGQVGRCFKDRLPETWELIAADSKTLDITDPAAVERMINTFEPDAVVNAAGYTAVDNAEHELAKAFKINAHGVRNLAQASFRTGARFIHLSSDYVFDGAAKRPYTEIDAPNPQNTYGRSKLAGELLALVSNPDSIIIRTSWVFSEYGNNFVKKILSAAREQSEVQAVNDQIGNPTYAGDLAQTMISILEKPMFHQGLYHYCGNPPVSRYDLALAILHAAQEHNPDFQPAPLVGIGSSDAGTEYALRPSYTALSCHKIQEAGIPPSDWQTALHTVISKL